MGDLDNLGKLKVKNIETKDIALEAATGGSANKIHITVQNDLAISYVLTMPQNPPETRDTLQSVPGGFAGFFRWDKSIEYETSTGISADSADNNNKIFTATNSGTASYGINDIWKRITNWYTTVELEDYHYPNNDQDIVHETDSDEFFIGSKYPIIAKIPVPPTYDSIGWLRIETEPFSAPQAETIDDEDPTYFLNQNLVISHDVFSASSVVYNNMVIVKHPYTYNLTANAGCPAYPACVPYVEWEYVGTANLTQIETVFGFVNESSPEDSGLAASQLNWGNQPEMSNSGGVIAHIGDPSTNTSWLHNGVLSAATNMVTPTTTWSVKCCDRIQFCVDAGGGAGTNSAEIVYVRYNQRMGISTTTGLTISNPTQKYYCMSTKGEKWRVSREPKLYQGSLSPNTYILNL